jgi:hypothetical protein
VVSTLAARPVRSSVTSQQATRWFGPTCSITGTCAAQTSMA